MNVPSNKKGCTGDILLIIFAVIAITFSMIVLAPGIVITSVVDTFKPLTIGPLWGTTLTVSLALLLFLYFTKKDGYIIRYFFISFCVFIVGLIYTLFDDTNIIFLTAKKMYPFFEALLTKKQ